MKKFKNPEVGAVFRAYPPAVRPKLMRLREIILDTAAGTDGVGNLEETLKWGEPAYLTTQSKSGSTIRLGWKKSQPNEYAMHFICTTTLVDTFRMTFPHEFKFAGNRSIVFDKDAKLPIKPLRECVALALTYHRDRRS